MSSNRWHSWWFSWWPFGKQKCPEPALTPAPSLSSFSDEELLAEVKMRGILVEGKWALSDCDLARTALTYNLPLFFAGFPAWYVDHPLFVLRMHMEKREIGFKEAGLRIIRQEGYNGFFAGSSSYGLRTVYAERRLPTYNECRERFFFSLACLRLPFAFSLSSLSIGYFDQDQSSRIVPGLCCFFSGFAAALFCCPAESLMRQSVCSQADFVASSEKHRAFMQLPWYHRVPLQAAGLDPIKQVEYSTPASIAASSQFSSLFHGWPLDSMRFGFFFVGFFLQYKKQTGHYPDNTWLNDEWQRALHAGSLAILTGSCAALPFDAVKALGHYRQRETYPSLSVFSRSVPVILGQRIGYHCVQLLCFATLVPVFHKLSLHEKPPQWWLLSARETCLNGKPVFLNATTQKHAMKLDQVN